VVTVEEHTVIGGLGGAVAECLLEARVSLLGFLRIGIRDCYPEIVGDQHYLRGRFGLDAAAIAQTVLGLFQE
jgi:transketolase